MVKNKFKNAETLIDLTFLKNITQRYKPFEIFKYVKVCLFRKNLFRFFLNRLNDRFRLDFREIEYFRVLLGISGFVLVWRCLFLSHLILDFVHIFLLVNKAYCEEKEKKKLSRVR